MAKMITLHMPPTVISRIEPWRTHPKNEPPRCTPNEQPPKPHVVRSSPKVSDLGSHVPHLGVKELWITIADLFIPQVAGAAGGANHTTAESRRTRCGLGGTDRKRRVQPGEAVGSKHATGATGQVGCL